MFHRLIEDGTLMAYETGSGSTNSDGLWRNQLAHDSAYHVGSNGDEWVKAELFSTHPLQITEESSRGGNRPCKENPHEADER